MESVNLGLLEAERLERRRRREGRTSSRQQPPSASTIPAAEKTRTDDFAPQRSERGFVAPSGNAVAAGLAAAGYGQGWLDGSAHMLQSPADAGRPPSGALSTLGRGREGSSVAGDSPADSGMSLRERYIHRELDEDEVASRRARREEARRASAARKRKTAAAPAATSGAPAAAVQARVAPTDISASDDGSTATTAAVLTSRERARGGGAASGGIPSRAVSRAPAPAAPASAAYSPLATSPVEDKKMRRSARGRPPSGAPSMAAAPAWGGSGKDLVLGLRTKPPGRAAEPAAPTSSRARQRAAALEEEMELLTADEEALDLSAFGPARLSFGGESHPGSESMMSSGEHGRDIAQLRGYEGGGVGQQQWREAEGEAEEGEEGGSAWGSGLERYEPGPVIPAPRAGNKDGGALKFVRPVRVEVTNHAEAPAADMRLVATGDSPKTDKAPAAGRSEDGDTDEAASGALMSRVAKANALLMGAEAGKAAVAVEPPGLADTYNRVAFLSQPGPREGMMQLYIRRSKGLYGQYPSFELYTQQGDSFLLAARRRKKTKSSYYIISLDPKELTRSSESVHAKLRSNYVGTEYVAYDIGGKHSDLGSHSSDRDSEDDAGGELVAVRYKQTVVSKGGGPRCMSVVLPAPGAMGPRDQRRLVEQYKAAKAGEAGGKRRGGVCVLRNLKPVWDDAIKGYSLDFGGRVTESSVKNFQLARLQPGSAEPEGPVLCQFGRTGHDTFALDYAHPLSVEQAFMVALSSIDNKLCYSM
eukprot:jgi/Tetstr1/462834/TSEL_007784.t1